MAQNYPLEFAWRPRRDRWQNPDVRDCRRPEFWRFAGAGVDICPERQDPEAAGLARIRAVMRTGPRAQRKRRVQQSRKSGAAMAGAVLGRHSFRRPGPRGRTGNWRQLSLSADAPVGERDDYQERDECRDRVLQSVDEKGAHGDSQERHDAENRRVRVAMQAHGKASDSLRAKGAPKSHVG